MTKRKIRAEEAKRKLGGISSTTLWRWENKFPDFPRGVCLPGSSIKLWSEPELDEWIEKRFSPRGIKK